MGKKGLKEFIEVYDISVEMGWLALDLAQNLAFRFEYAKDKNVQEEDVHMAYGLTLAGGRKYPHDIMGAIHKLANALGYTREDYIDNQRERCKGNVNIYVAGEGRSVNCDVKDLIKGGK